MGLREWFLLPFSHYSFSLSIPVPSQPHARGVPNPCGTLLPGPNPTGGVRLEELFGRAAKRRAGGGMENGEGCWTQHGAQPNLEKWGKKLQKHIPNGDQGSWRGAVTRAPVLHLPSLYFLSCKVALLRNGSESGSIRYKESLGAIAHLCVTSARLRSQPLITLHSAAG